MDSRDRRARAVRRRFVPVAAGALALALAACDRADTAPQVAPSVRINEVVLEDPATGAIIYSHMDHWHGFPIVPDGGTLTLRKFFTAFSAHPDDHDPPSRGDWISLDSLPAEINTRIVASDTTVLRAVGTRVQMQLTGRRTASTPVSMVVRRATTTLYEAPPLNAVVR